MYHSINEFLKDWEDESQKTLKIFKSLTDESLTVKVAPGERSLGFLAWHIANTIGEMVGKTGLDVQPADDHSEEPASVDQIVSVYQSSSEAMVNSMKDKWTDETLSQEFNMYGQVWKGVDVLSALVKHEIHHRGQMTVLMRLAGLPVSGSYGPSREEWLAYGMQPHK